MITNGVVTSRYKVFLSYLRLQVEPFAVLLQSADHSAQPCRPPSLKLRRGALLVRTDGVHPEYLQPLYNLLIFLLEYESRHTGRSHRISYQLPVTRWFIKLYIK